MHTHTDSCMSVYTHTYMYTFLWHMYIPIHTFMHTYIHTYKLQLHDVAVKSVQKYIPL